MSHFSILILRPVDLSALQEILKLHVTLLRHVFISNIYPKCISCKNAFLLEFNSVIMVNVE